MLIRVFIHYVICKVVHLMHTYNIFIYYMDITEFVRIRYFDILDIVSNCILAMYLTCRFEPPSNYLDKLIYNSIS